MKFKKLVRNNSAVAGVLEAILLIALVAIVLSMIQLYYVPIIMEQKEADHMDQVSNQFSQLKSVIEIQAMMGTMDTGEPITYTPMSSPVTLGSKELPYFVSARSYGQIDLTDSNDAGDYEINIQPAPSEYPTGIPLTSIKYRATNFYYPKDEVGGTIEPWQEYVLEGGGIILKQSNGEIMRVQPGISVENNSGSGSIKIKYFIPVFNGVPGKKIWGGFGMYEDCYIHTNYSEHYTHSDSTSYIHIDTQYAEAWYDSFVNESNGILWEHIENGYLDVNLIESSTPNRVEITPEPGYTLNIELTIAELNVQVGPGYAVRRES